MTLAAFSTIVVSMLVPKKLRDARRMLRWSQSALARKAGVPRHRITLYELGDLMLTETEQRKVISALEVERERLRNLPPFAEVAS